MKKITLAFVILSLCCCTNEDPLEDSSASVFGSDEAYLPVEITNDGSSIHRAKSTDEEAASKANFYFFNSNGEYITKGEIYFNDNNPTGQDIVILKNLKDKTYPKYVVTVLNQTSDIQTETIDEMNELLSGTTNCGIKDGDGHFVMTTSSYNDDDRTYTFATEISDDNFVEGDIDWTDVDLNPVIIPVEPLAAKVTVDLNDDLKNSATTVEGSDGQHTLYQINETGYVEILGWKINAIARQSNMFKNIVGISNPLTSTDWNWNDSTNKRSDWGKSYNYGLSDSAYPSSNNGNRENDEEDSSKQLNSYLKYVSLNTDVVEMGGSSYCAENTNTVGSDGIIKDITNSASAITSVLIKAKAWTATTSGANTSYTPASNDMYYNIPIKHLNQPETDGELVEGEYGVVRNFHYNVTINNIISYGTEIDDPEEVIVPEHNAVGVSTQTISYDWSCEKESVKQGDGVYIDVTIPD